MVLVICFVFLFLAEIDPTISSSSPFLKQQDPKKNNEEVLEPLQISTRKGKFLGRLAFLMDLGNKATPSSYIKESNKNFISRWSPYFAAVYEPFPFNSQSFIPTDIFQIWGSGEPQKDPPNTTDDFRVFRVIDHENDSTNVSISLDGENQTKAPEDVEIISNFTSEPNLQPKEELLFAEEEKKNITTMPEITTTQKPHASPQKHNTTSKKPTTTQKPEITTLEMEISKPGETEVTTMKTSTQRPKTTSTTTTHSGITATAPETTNNTNPMGSNFNGYYGGFPQQIDNVFLTTSSSLPDQLYFNSQGQRQTDNLNNAYDNNYVSGNYDSSYANEYPPRYGDTENFRDYFEPEIVDLNGFRPNYAH